jgi:hypothetical protein
VKAGLLAWVCDGYCMGSCGRRKAGIDHRLPATKVSSYTSIEDNVDKQEESC